MKLFFKHLIRSIGKRPLQPIIIILTIALSFLVCASALTIKSSLSDEMSKMNEASYGSSDIVIKLNSNSKSRFMFDTEAERVLNGKANAVGTYEMIFLLNGESTMARAVDLTEIDSVFDFQFSDYGEINAGQLATTLIITEDFARTEKLSLGDKVSLELFGKKIEYKVCAISKSPFFDGCDIMVDITGVIKALGSESLFISALDDIKPYSSIYIDVLNDSQKNECISLLSKSSEFSDKSIIDVSQSVNKGVIELTLPLIVNICIVLCCFLMAVVVFSSIYILSKQRVEENDSFISIGTRKKALNLLQYLEVTIYWLIGTVIGAVLLLPVVFLSGLYLSFKYAIFIPSFWNVLLTFLLTLLIVLLTTTLFIITRGKIKARRIGSAISIVLLSLLVIMFVITMSSWGNIRLSMGIITTFLVIALVFFSTPCLISKLLDLVFIAIQKRQERGKGIKHVSLYYALKNFKSVSVLSNTTRLLGVVFIIVFSILTIVIASHGNLNATKKYYNGDFIVLNATERCYNEIKKQDSIKEISRVYNSTASYDNGYLVQMTSTDNLAVLGKGIKIDKLPKGNEAIISKTVSRALGVKKGEKLPIKLEGEMVELYVSDVIQMGTAAIVFDHEHYGLSPNMILLEAKDGRNDELLDSVTAISASELSTVISAERLRAEKIESNTSFLKCANFLLFAIEIYAMVGIINNLYESYRARREELSLYHFAGISKSKIAKIVLFEILAILVIGLFLGAIGTIVATLSLDKAFSQFNFDMLSYLRYFFI